MNKKWLLGLAMIMVVPAYCSPFIKVEYANHASRNKSNTISYTVKLTNTSGVATKLEDYTVRYYYTKDQDIEQLLHCDHAAITSNKGYQNIQSDVHATFHEVTKKTEMADTYVEINFKGSKYQLEPNASAELQLRITNKNWLDYDQNNDFSYSEKHKECSSWSHIAVYQKGVLVSGETPDGEVIGEVQDDSFAFLLPTVTCKKGDKVTLKLNVQNEPEGINNMDFVLGLDLEAFEFVKAEAGELLNTKEKKEGLMTSFHKENGNLNVMYVDSKQDGTGLLSETGNFMTVEVISKKDYKGMPLTYKQKGAINGQKLNPLKVEFKTK